MKAVIQGDDIAKRFFAGQIESNTEHLRFCAQRLRQLADEVDRAANGDAQHATMSTNSLAMLALDIERRIETSRQMAVFVNMMTDKPDPPERYGPRPPTAEEKKMMDKKARKKRPADEIVL